MKEDGALHGHRFSRHLEVGFGSYEQFCVLDVYGHFWLAGRGHYSRPLVPWLDVGGCGDHRMGFSFF